MRKALGALALAALAVLPVTAEALSLGAESIYTPSLGGCVLSFCLDAPAAFVLTNSSAAGGNITQVVIDMTTAASSSARFGGSPGLVPNYGFTPVSGVSDTGFTTASVTDKIVTLNFTGFDPGDVLGFSFIVDIDDGTRTVTAEDFAGSTFKVIFGGLATLTGAFEPVVYVHDAIARAEVRGVARVPEPASFVLVGVSLLALVLVGRKRMSAGIVR